MIVINVKAFWARLSEMGMGSGNLASRLGMHPDIIQSMIRTTECPDEEGEILLKFLGLGILEKLPIGDYSIKHIKTRVESGEWTIEDVLEKEMARENPRKGILEWAEERMAPVPELDETIEETMEEIDEEDAEV